jgi:cellulose synthase (UDP-forming)
MRMRHHRESTTSNVSLAVCTMSRIFRVPVLGPFFTDLLRKESVTHRRHGDREDRGRRLRAQGLAMVTICTGAAYLTWIMLAVNWEHRVIGSTFVLAELGCYALFILASAGAWRMRFKPADPLLPLVPTSVDVLITVCGEPEQVVARTVAAAAGISWPGELNVYVLDDKGDAAIERVAARYGVSYLSRPKDNAGNSDAKAGNLNYGLRRSTGEYVLTLDADQVPSPQILERLAPYLAVPNTAFVQSKQSFLVPHGDPFYCQDLVFYNTLQQAFDAHDMVLSCGSGVLYRRAALDDIGGFVTWNLVEDLTTSYELHCRGWKSLYYPYPLAAGLAPDTLWGVYRQRGQWALDTMRLFFWRNPLTRPTLAWPRRINYFIIGFSYLTAGFVAPLFYMIPLWSYVTGDALLVGHELDFVLFRSCYFISMTLAMRWLFRNHEPGKQFQMLVGLFPVYMINTVRALMHRRSKPVYKVNNARRKRRHVPPILALLPQLFLLLANAIGPFYALAMGSASLRVITANACVSALALWSLSHVCVAAFNRHTWQTEANPVAFYAAPVEA